MRARFHLFLTFLSIIFTVGCASNKTILKENTISSNYEDNTLIGPKKRIFVAEFDNKTTYGQNRLGAAISDVLTTELARSGRYIILEREKLNVILEEQALSQTGIISESSVPKFGALLGANAIITGSVTQFGVRTQIKDQIITASKEQIATCAVDIRIVDVNYGTIVWAGSGQGQASRKYSQVLGSGASGGYDETLEGDAFRAAVVQLIENMVGELQNIPWSCNVVKVADNKIFINAGQKSNINIGDNLDFFLQGEAIIDPSTGIELGKEESYAGSGEVIGFLGADAAIVQLTEGSFPQVGSISRMKNN